MFLLTEAEKTLGGTDQGCREEARRGQNQYFYNHSVGTMLSLRCLSDLFEWGCQAKSWIYKSSVWERGIGI